MTRTLDWVVAGGYAGLGAWILAPLACFIFKAVSDGRAFAARRWKGLAFYCALLLVAVPPFIIMTVTKDSSAATFGFVLVSLTLFSSPALCWMMLLDKSAISDAAARACLRCGYDLTGNTSGICPECGQDVPDRQRRGLNRPR
jgi:hypothetical protein